MAIFGVLTLEDIVAVGDKTRLYAHKSFITPDEAAITLLEIEPEAGAGFIDVTNTDPDKLYLDWIYGGASREVTVSVRITTDGAPETFTNTLQVLTEADDNLFSSDKDLVGIESEIVKYLPKGKISFKYVHRKAQTLILSELDESGFQNSDGSRITKDQILDAEEVNRWSLYLTLWLIYNDLSNAPEDTFAIKAQSYLGRANFHKERSFLRIDYNKDATLDRIEQLSVRSQRLDRA